MGTLLGAGFSSIFDAKRQKKYWTQKSTPKVGPRGRGWVDGSEMKIFAFDATDKYKNEAIKIYLKETVRNIILSQ